MHQTNRDAEFERLCRLLDDGLNVAVAGPRGSGRTTVLGRLDDGTRRLVHVPCSRGESGVRLSGLDIMTAALGTLATTGESAVESAMADPATDAEISERFVTLVRSLPGPTIVVVDDADTMDPASQEVLGHVLRRAGGRLRIVVAVRSVAHEGPFAGVPTVTLEPLDHDASVALAHHLLPDQLAPESAELVARAGRGNPMIIRHLLEHLTPRQRRGDTALPRPLRTGAALHEKLAEEYGTFDAETTDILRILSLAPLTSARPLQVRFPDLWERLDDLEAAGVVERDGACLRFESELLRSAVHQEMTAGERIERHRLMSEQCATADPRLARWHDSFRDPDPERSPGLLADARRYLAEGRADAGIEFCERALLLSPDPGQHARALLDVAAELLTLGEFAFADRCIRLAATSGAPAERIEARTLSILTEFVRTQSLPSGFRGAWSRIEAAQAPAEVAGLQLTLALCHAWKCELTESEELLDEAATLGVDLDVHARDLRTSVGLLLDSSRGRSESALSAFERFVAGEVTDVVAGVILAEALARTEHYHRARAVLDHLDAAHPRPTIWKSWIATLGAEIEMRSGRIGQALAMVDEARMRRRQCPSAREDRSLVLECWQLLTEGRASEAETVEARLVDHAARADNGRLVAALNALQGAYLLSVDLPAEALRHLQRCEELSAGVTNPNALRYEPDLIEALVRVGRRDHAALALQRFRKRLERCPSRWGELAADRCHALLTADERSLEEFGRALRKFGLRDSAFDKARLLQAFARRLEELGHRAQADEQAKTAAILFGEAGSPRTAAAVPRRPAESPVAADEELLAQLTEEEQTIVELVRTGLKNRDIARRVFVSLRTVELRLTSVYRKLGVGSRTELLARLSSRPATVLIPVPSEIARTRRPAAV
ncbi:regulatory LuxR family protein [Brevibacterium sanguinis]|uniref:Regulatory LuxR family protein n=2 Tax=Brevibacterium TaxID=1696 RepID=A0A366ILY5_9MICO|nr:MULTISPECIES: LuxR C-terminal-related transcriptional regulator [Brevibacterium]RBP66977.1 regulatory LuxR family protein [Brevibacterium sanguinis]RBP73502.1 regulatory LuxR family protein [Brevibacterium celere]